MHLLPIEISSRQAGKLRKGHPVRIKKGSGMNLIVSPGNYRLASKAFAKNKGLEIKLSPEEIEMNRSLTPEQHNQLRKEASTLDMFKELPFSGKGLFAGGDIMDKVIEKLADKGLDKLIDVGGKWASKKLGVGLYAGARGSGLEEELNQKLGTNHGYLKRATLGSSRANDELGEYSTHSFGSKRSVSPIKTYWNTVNEPPSRGTGIKHHRMTSMVHPGRRSTGMVVGRGTLHSDDDFLPPALRSQPYGANFHLQFQLPPQYHRYNNGGEDIGH